VFAADHRSACTEMTQQLSTTHRPQCERLDSKDTTKAKNPKYQSA